MQKEFLFGRVDLNEFEDDGTFFKSPNGHLYWYRMTVDEDTATFEDTCGRRFPIDREMAQDMGVAIFVLEQMNRAEDDAAEAYNKRVRETNAVVEHFVKERYGE
jgi:hypothetical protein